MYMYIVIEYNRNYSEKFGRLWQYYRNYLNDKITDF